jgi:hypothetical protein
MRVSCYSDGAYVHRPAGFNVEKSRKKNSVGRPTTSIQAEDASEFSRFAIRLIRALGSVSSDRSAPKYIPTI